MRLLPLAFIFAATPAFAHHEVIMATSMLPTMLGLATIAAAGLGALWQKWRRK